MGAHKGKPGMLAGVSTAIAGAVVVVHGAWLHLKDAEIYHPNIRVVESADPGGRADEESRKARNRTTVIENEGEGETRPVSASPSGRPDGRRVVSSRPR